VVLGWDVLEKAFYENFIELVRQVDAGEVELIPWNPDELFDIETTEHQEDL
jgi:hypothetical protein